MLATNKLQLTITLFTLFIFGKLISQKPQPYYHIQETTEKIKVDGILDEEVWKNADIASDFYQNFPNDTGFAKTLTDVFLTYDKTSIYIAAICHDDLEGQYVIQSLKRDFSYPISDAFEVYINPFNDLTNGYSFGVNPMGVQREGLLQNGGNYGVTTAWDNKWYSAVTRGKNQWIVEMRIPFQSFQFKDGEKEWRVNFSRNDLKRNENSSWSYVPQNFNIATLAYCGVLLWDKPVDKKGLNYAIIPYLSTRLAEDYRDKSQSISEINGGLDAKISVTPSLQLDLTFNPDFSQVEVDRQVTNLSRFSIYFPERRNFFIENSDLFANFGFRQIRPFFSRRIGLNNGQPKPILAGARLSGKLNQKWRIGLMNMQTEGQLNSPAENFTVAAIQRQVFTSSNIAAIFVNRQGFVGDNISFHDFNRVVGLEYNLATKNNRYKGKAFYHHSFSPNIKTENYSHASWLSYSTKSTFLMWNHEYVGKNYNADVGFVPRIDRYNPETGNIERHSYWRLEPEIAYSFFPKNSKKITYHKGGIYYDGYYDSSYNVTDHLVNPYYKLLFSNSSYIQANTRYFYTKLYFDRDVSFSGLNPIPNGNYEYKSIGLSYYSNSRKKLYYSLELNTGEYFNGNRHQVTAALSYRVQPWGTVTVDVDQNYIDMQQYGSSDLTLLGLDLSLSFTKSLFFSSFFQYNTQIQNFNINTRLQWRYKPMSDFYIVYTDNYDTYNFAIKNRALVFKFVYWFTRL